jgi:hypothetical protein
MMRKALPMQGFFILYNEVHINIKIDRIITYAETQRKTTETLAALSTDYF